MNDELGLPDDVYNALLETVKIKSLYDYVMEYGHGNVSVYYYIDENGKFIPPRNNAAKIAKALFDNMNPKDKLNVLHYLEDYTEGNIK